MLSGLVDMCTIYLRLYVVAAFAAIMCTSKSGRLQ